MKQETVVSKPNPLEANQQLKDEAANQNEKKKLDTQADWELSK